MGIRSIVSKAAPPRGWRTAVIVLLGMMAGLLIYIAYISNVTSYLTDDPVACVNCHVMTPQYITWQHSSHREIATCNDCHVPQDNPLKKYAFKARDGLYHATIYTLRTEPQAIIMHEEGRQAVQSNCIRCHVDQVTDPFLNSTIPGHSANRLQRVCWDCHREVPHGRVRSLSSVGYHLEVLPVHVRQEQFVPDWLEDLTDNSIK